MICLFVWVVERPIDFAEETYSSFSRKVGLRPTLDDESDQSQKRFQTYLKMEAHPLRYSI